MKNHWKPDSYTAEQLEALIKDKKITIPPYQRGIVWDDKKRDKLIDTIKNGYPFGSILLYEDQASGTFQLIDGLQRSSTIFEFVNNPAKYFNIDDIDEAAINQIYKLIEVSGNETEIKEKIKTSLINWVHNKHKTMKDVKSMQYIDFAYCLLEEFPSLNNPLKLRRVAEVITPMLTEYMNMCDYMLNAQIPALKFYGSEEVLPEIFERINSTGATLTKYQIFSATWSNVGIKITNDSLNGILDFVCNRYDSMVGGNFEIANYDSTKIKRDRTVSAFDLCFGFGKLLVKDYPYLFGNSNDPLKIESIGFTLINSCLGNRFSELKSLHTNLKKLGDNNVNKLLIEILSCCKTINRYLNVLTAFKGNSRDSKNIRINHTELQIASIIVSMFTTQHVSFELNDDGEIIGKKYDFDNVSEAWNLNKEAFCRNMRIAYLQDILSEKWRGSGDRKLEYILTNPDYYRREISFEEFEKNFDNWYTTILFGRNEEKKVQIPKESDHVVLNLVYAKTFSAIDHLDESKFDIEHLIPKNLLKKRLEDYNRGKDDELRIKLPISSIGNVCYLPEGLNRSKGNKTIYEVDYDAEQLEEIEAKYSFTKKEDMDWLYEDLNGNEFKNRFIDFLDKRSNIIKQRIKEILF